MFVLQLNDMRRSNVGILTPVARAKTKEELEQFMKQEQVEDYRDGLGRWRKYFRKDGPLEWFNKPLSKYCLRSISHIIDVGTKTEWPEIGLKSYQVMTLRFIQYEKAKND